MSTCRALQIAEKILAAPVPTDEDRARNAFRKLNDKRSGGELRGNSYDRRRRAAKLVHEFGDGTHAHCWRCGCTVTAQTLEQDKIFTTDQGGRYTMANLLPACGPCNRQRGDQEIRKIPVHA